MNDETNRRDSSLLSSVQDILRLIVEYPKLSVPLGAVFAVFWFASVFKTLVDGFHWAYEKKGLHGVLVVVAVIAFIAMAGILVIRRAVATRPVIRPFPRHHLSRNPIVKWDYDLADARNSGYRLRMTRIGTRIVKLINVPERVRQFSIPDVTGDLRISICALSSAGKTSSRYSPAIRTEIYHDSVQRLRETGTLRVAVHTDPAEQIFCYFLDGRWQGLDIDFATLIASELERDPDIARPLEVKCFFFEWPAIIGAPNAHEVDMAIASITISAERTRKYGVYFSVPYAESKLGVVARSHTFNGQEQGTSVPLSSLNGKTVAIHKETTALEIIEKAAQDPRYVGIGIQSADNNDELRELLRDNSVDAVVHDYHRAFTLLEPGMTVHGLDHDFATRPDEYGIVFSKVNSLLREKVDAILKQHRLRITTALARCIEDVRRSIQAQGAENDADRPAISGSANLFVYGSLLYEPVWRRLVSRDFERKAARLGGYRRLRIKNEDYPGLVRGVGTVHGAVWLDVDEQTRRRIDDFEAACYRRASGVVIDDAGTEIAAEFFTIKESSRSILEKAEWDPKEFESRGLARFTKSYRGFDSH